MPHVVPPPDFVSMPELELAACWTVVGLDVPSVLVEETLNRGARMIPFLGPMIASPTAWTELRAEAGWAAPHALMLLCRIGGPELLPYAADFLQHGLGEDWMTEEGHLLVRSAGIEGLEPMAALIQDAAVDAYGRWAAIDGLCLLALEEPGHRARIVAALRAAAQELYGMPEEDFERDDRTVLTQLCETLALLHDGESRALSERVFAEGRWDGDHCRFLDLRECFEQPFEETLQELRRDPLKHFSKEELERLRCVEKGIESPQDRRILAAVDTWEKMEAVAERVVGGAAPPNPAGGLGLADRNAPAPAGVGRSSRSAAGRRGNRVACAANRNLDTRPTERFVSSPV